MSKYSYRTKLLLYYLSVFLIFLIFTGIFQYSREKKYQIEKLEKTLDNVTEITRNYIDVNKILDNRKFSLLDSLLELIPQADDRITLIDKDGNVFYDSTIPNYRDLENHIQRPEISKAKYKAHGSSIRQSQSTGKSYYYYSTYKDYYFVRYAVVYDVQIIQFLKANSFFFYFMISLFLFVFVLIWFVSEKFSRNISLLKDFVLNTDKYPSFKPKFQNDEIGEIGNQITNIYDNLKSVRNDLLVQKEKLFRHLMISNEGIAIYNSDKEKILSNQHFINYLNIIADKSLISDEDLFHVKAFRKINQFINDQLSTRLINTKHGQNETQLKIAKNNRFFIVKCIVFQDKSFEIIITNITKREKNRIIKQEMTSNIAHELKTPVAAIQGYLETMLRHSNLDEDKKNHFIQKSFNQSKRLSLLIDDIAIVNKLENASDFFIKSEVNIYITINDIRDSTLIRRNDKNILITHDMNKELIIKGNTELINSIFQNLIENSIKYAGNDIEIKISMYHEDRNYYYFSYSDSGVGIAPKHLERIFERFYRVDSGRTRKEGGTGLGLSIVKNAIEFHRGKISAKVGTEGGVEFLFNLKKI